MLLLYTALLSALHQPKSFPTLRSAQVPPDLESLELLSVHSELLLLLKFGFTYIPRFYEVYVISLVRLEPPKDRDHC